MAGHNLDSKTIHKFAFYLAIWLAISYAFEAIMAHFQITSKAIEAGIWVAVVVALLLIGYRLNLFNH